VELVNWREKTGRDSACREVFAAAASPVSGARC
jgi:hypothetical protein